MKICIIVPYFTPFVRGNEYGLANTLTKLGYDVTIIASKGKAPRELSKDFDRGLDLAFKVIYLPTLVDISDTPIVIELRLEGYDVALLQEDYPFICHKAYKEAGKRGISTVLSSERTYYPEDLVKKMSLKMLDKLINKKLRDGVDVLTAHCSAAKDFMERDLGVRRGIEIVHVGVDTELFKPLNTTEKYLSEGQLKILTVARLHKYKGLEYLIEAMGLLQEIRDVKLYIMGKGDEERNLKELVRRLDLERTVEFVDKPVPNHRMPFFYGECDIYVQPSRIEPYGIAVLEAMACGKPVIGTKVGGMLDTIKDGETGFLVEPKNASEIADRIRFLRNDKLRTEMGKKAREWVVEKFDWTVIGEKYQAIIESLT